MDEQQQDSQVPRALGNNLNRLLLEFGQDYERRVMAEIHKHGHTLIRPSHVTVFSNLGLGAVRVTELADKAHVTQQAMGKMLKELERIGYVVRDIDGSDRRAKKIRPTERGLDLMHRIVEVTEKIRQFYASQVGEDTLADLEQRLTLCMRKISSDRLTPNWQRSERVA